MEKQDFLPRVALTDDRDRRDLPPVEFPPVGRMETAGGGCGCAQTNPCVGYEGCSEGSWGLCEHPLAMVYAPCQYFRALYDPATALNRGTLFTELDLPFGGEGSFTAEGCACRRRKVQPPYL